MGNETNTENTSHGTKLINNDAKVVWNKGGRASLVGKVKVRVRVRVRGEEGWRDGLK